MIVLVDELTRFVVQNILFALICVFTVTGVSAFVEVLFVFQNVWLCSDSLHLDGMGLFVLNVEIRDGNAKC